MNQEELCLISEEKSIKLENSMRKRKAKKNMSWITQPHDTFCKQCLSDIRIAKDFLKAYLPKSVQAWLVLEELSMEPQNMITALSKELRADGVFKIPFKGDPGQDSGHLLLLFEHLSTAPPLTAFDVRQYEVQLINQFIKKNPKTKTIPMIYSFVLHNGKKPFDKPKDVRGLLKAPRHLVDSLPYEPFILIDLKIIKDDVIRQHGWASSMQLAMKYIHQKEVLIDPYLKEIWLTLSAQGEHRLLAYMIEYILSAGGFSKAEILLLSKTLPYELGDKMMSAAREFREEGRQEGRQEGQQEGKQQAKNEDAIEIVKQTGDFELASKVTKLPIDKIKHLIENLNGD